MKIIIDIDDEMVCNDIKNEALEPTSETDKVIINALYNGTPVSNEGDLISRKALIKWIDDSVSQYGHIYSTDMLNMWGLFKDYLINNAPTIPLPDFKDGYKQAILDGKTNFSRPQGKWIFHKDFNESCRYGCNQCGNLTNIPSNFCPNCGVEMRGGIE